MSERADSPPASAGGTRQSKVESNDGATARRTLLEEARQTKDQQLGQINTIDAAAVRTVRIALLLLGLLVGGSRLSSVLNLGLFGTLGMGSLVGALLTGLFVYGTSQLFIGSSLDELEVDYGEDSAQELAHDKLINEYEDGLRTNRKILHLNGFVLAVARSLLALSIVFVVGAFHHGATAASVV